MLTLKLRNTHKDCTHLVACRSLDVMADGMDYVVSGVGSDEKLFEFRVSADDEAQYNVAFVENLSGATTQVIRPRVRNVKSQ